MSSTTPNTPHDRLKLLRQRMDKSQPEMAAMLHLSLRGYQNYERGERDIPVVMLERAQEHIGLNPAWVLDGVGEMLVTGHRQKRTMKGGDFLRSEETSPLEPADSDSPSDRRKRQDATELVSAVLAKVELELGMGLRGVLRDLVVWHGLPADALEEVAMAVKEELQRTTKKR